jgi:hypothetical protein
MSHYVNGMQTVAADGRGGDRARGRLARSAKPAGLAAAVLCLAAACSTAASTPPASSPSATPGQGATQATAPTASASAGSSSPTLTVQPASAAQIAEFTAAAQGQCGFDTASDTLTYDKVTNSGWGIGAINADNPQDQGNAEMVFRLQGTSWVYVTCGSSFDNGSGIPFNVVQALM